MEELGDQRGLNTKEAHGRLLFGSHETSPILWLGKPGDTVLAKHREMTGRTQTLPWWLGEKGKRRQKIKYIGPVVGDHCKVVFACYLLESAG